MKHEDLLDNYTPCEVQANCRNSPGRAGPALAQCYLCRLAPGNEDLDAHYWSPINRRSPHPDLETERKAGQVARLASQRQQRRDRDRGKQDVARRAARAEKRTERQVIEATKNSGRSHRDGDHRVAESITLDTKFQSTRIHPVVRLDELEKARRDAKRAGHSIGGLVLQNRDGVSVVVLHLNDFALIASQLQKTKDEDQGQAE